MNAYLVISEELEYVEYEDWFVNAGHLEHYCIAELVAAESPGKAKYMAWKQDKESFSHDIRDMPKFSVKLKLKNIQEESCIITNNKKYQNLWDANDQ